MSAASHRSSPSVMSPNLTPLLDVVLQLITFFMMLVHFGSRLEGADRAIRLPVAPAALPGSDLTIDRLAVGLDAQGSLRVGGEVLSRSEARAWWAEQAMLRREGLELLESGGLGATGTAGGEDLPTVVVLRADRQASYGLVRRTLAEAQEQGFAHFSLVVLRRGQP
jgi:biopolymer transport protein ExbD